MFKKEEKGERFQYNLQKSFCHSKMLKKVLVVGKLEFCDSGW